LEPTNIQPVLKPSGKISLLPSYFGALGDDVAAGWAKPCAYAEACRAKAIAANNAMAGRMRFNMAFTGPFESCYFKGYLCPYNRSGSTSDFVAYRPR
jgi:hypothetical protein